MIKNICILSIACLVFFSCETGVKNSDKNINPIADKIKTPIDSAYQQVLDIHNETMGKYGKMMGYESKIKAMIDSLANNKKDVNEFVKISAKLKIAHQEMDDWMAQFVAEPKLNNDAEKLNYFKDQKLKAQKMRNDFFDALQVGDSLFSVK